MIGCPEKTTGETGNEKVGLLLESTATDEEGHRALVSEIMDIVMKGETITEANCGISSGGRFLFTVHRDEN